MTDKAKRAVISIAGIDVEVFQMPNGDYAMSQTQASEAIGKHRNSMLRFLGARQAKANEDKVFQCYTVPIEKDWQGQGNRQDIKIIPINIASDFWMAQAFKGSTEAQALIQACMQEALQRRCDNAFKVSKTEQEYEDQAINSREAWEQSRGYCRDVHASFQNSCVRWKFHSGVAHDAITIAVCGKTASELRELEVINGTSSIGLNHVADRDLLVKIAKVKLQFSKYRTGSIKERVARALKDISTPEIKSVNKQCLESKEPIPETSFDEPCKAESDLTQYIHAYFDELEKQIAADAEEDMLPASAKATMERVNPVLLKAYIEKHHNYRVSEGRFEQVKIIMQSLGYSYKLHYSSYAFIKGN